MTFSCFCDSFYFGSGVKGVGVIVGMPDLDSVVGKESCARRLTHAFRFVLRTSTRVFLCLERAYPPGPVTTLIFGRLAMDSNRSIPARDRWAKCTRGLRRQGCNICARLCDLERTNYIQSTIWSPTHLTSSQPQLAVQAPELTLVGVECFDSRRQPRTCSRWDDLVDMHLIRLAAYRGFSMSVS